MADEITSNSAPVNTPVPQAPETLVSTPPEAIIAPAPVEAPVAPVPTLEPIPEPQTAQMGGNEPLAHVPAETQTAPTEPVIETVPEPTITEAPAPVQPTTEVTPVVQVVAPVIAQTFTKSIRELFTKAQLTIQNRKRKKLDRIMSLFAKQTMITNNEVEKLLHVSDATATRYLSALEKEGKIKQNKKTGKGVTYSKI